MFLQILNNRSGRGIQIMRKLWFHKVKSAPVRSVKYG